jgi:RNA polymerase sigma factor (sigma-70 family)
MASLPTTRPCTRAPARQRRLAGARASYGGRPVDSDLLDAFRRREPQAVRALYHEYGHLVYTVALRTLGRRDLAEDATQQTFVRAWQAADRLDVNRNIAPWLATIAKRVAIDIYRHEARRPASGFDEVSPDDPALVTLPPELGTTDAVWRVRRAIDELPPEEAAVVRMQHLDGMTHAEIAEKLDIPLGTVKSRSHRAHAKLARLLGHLREPLT